jgi:phosphatidylserine/phosphatidylglycerophosphate/cardiolipin synthase-like enzyme
MKQLQTWCLVAFLLVPLALLAGNNPFGDSAVPAGGDVTSTAPTVKTTQAPVTVAKAGAVMMPRYSLDQVFDALSQRQPAARARLRYVWANDDAWYCRWKMISDAQKTIDCTYYIIDKDIFGQAFLGLLIYKARRGVKIRLMVDGRIARSGYMKGMHDRIQELAAFPGVQVKYFNSVSQSLLHAFTDFKGLFASNHDKIIIADGKLCITGGRNIGPDYYGAYGEYPIIYRDSDILIEGPEMSAKMKKAFDDEWVCLRNSVIKPDMFNYNNQLDRLQIAAIVMDRWIKGMGVIDPAKTTWNKKQKELLTELNGEIAKYQHICGYSSYQLWTTETPKPVKMLDKYSHLGKTKVGQMNEITPALVAFCNAARKEIVVQNPYVVLTEEAWTAFRNASRRGVKIIIHSNSGASTDSIFPQAFLQNDWQRMLAEMPTCRIFVAPSQKERLHSKTFVFDSKITIVGSYNMDPLSQDSNSEMVAVVNDVEFGRSTREQIETDMAVVLEYKIRIGPDGKITKVFGPEDHLDAETMKKIERYRKLKWIRPVI